MSCSQDKIKKMVSSYGASNIIVRISNLNSDISHIESSLSKPVRFKTELLHSFGISDDDLNKLGTVSRDVFSGITDPISFPELLKKVNNKPLSSDKVLQQKVHKFVSSYVQADMESNNQKTSVMTDVFHFDKELMLDYKENFGVTFEYTENGTNFRMFGTLKSIADSLNKFKEHTYYERNVVASDKILKDLKITKTEAIMNRMESLSK